MSTLAGWLFAALTVLLVVVIVMVVMMAVRVVRKGRRLTVEADGMLRDLDAVVGSGAVHGSRGVPAQVSKVRHRAYPGYHRRDAPRQEEVDHG